jgi:hypothetical protein
MCSYCYNVYKVPKQLPTSLATHMGNLHKHGYHLQICGCACNLGVAHVNKPRDSKHVKKTRAGTYLKQTRDVTDDLSGQ